MIKTVFEYLFLIIASLMALEFAHRVIHFAKTGEGGPEDPVILRYIGKHEKSGNK